MGTSDLLSAGITRNIHAGHNNNSGPLGAYRSTVRRSSPAPMTRTIAGVAGSPNLLARGVLDLNGSMILLDFDERPLTEADASWV